LAEVSRRRHVLRGNSAQGDPLWRWLSVAVAAVAAAGGYVGACVDGGPHRYTDPAGGAASGGRQRHPDHLRPHSCEFGLRQPLDGSSHGDLDPYRLVGPGALMPGCWLAALSAENRGAICRLDGPRADTRPATVLADCGDRRPASVHEVWLGHAPGWWAGRAAARCRCGAVPVGNAAQLAMAWPARPEV
jgi:hypothetical protein